MVASQIAVMYPLDEPSSGFQNPEQDEISVTEEYVRPYGVTISSTPILRLPVREERDAEVSLRVMMAKQDHLRPGWSPSTASPPKLKPDKGKGRMRIFPTSGRGGRKNTPTS
jgi:hypothetical protein